MSIRFLMCNLFSMVDKKYMLKKISNYKINFVGAVTWLMEPKDCTDMDRANYNYAFINYNYAFMFVK
jgi:hypothetical protein